MSQELGKVEKPEVSSFKHNRKILQVPLVYSSKDAPADYTAMFDKYWQQAGEMIAKLENKLGNVTVILHESVTAEGEGGFKIISELNPRSFAICEEKRKTGGRLLPIENPVLLADVMDWERCLMIGLISENVARKVYESYTEASKQRYQHISTAIDSALKEGDIALLFIREGHPVQFPSDIDVFMVAPPVLDDIHRWMRERAARMEKEQE